MPDGLHEVDGHRGGLAAVIRSGLGDETITSKARELRFGIHLAADLEFFRRRAGACTRAQYGAQQHRSHQQVGRSRSFHEVNSGVIPVWLYCPENPLPIGLWSHRM